MIFLPISLWKQKEPDGILLFLYYKIYKHCWVCTSSQPVLKTPCPPSLTEEQLVLWSSFQKALKSYGLLWIFSLDLHSGTFPYRQTDRHTHCGYAVDPGSLERKSTIVLDPLYNIIKPKVQNNPKCHVWTFTPAVHIFRLQTTASRMIGDLVLSKGRPLS